MSYNVEFIGGFNPFEWEALRCPVCQKSDFVSHSHSVVYCDECGSRFQVRMTAGDPGCVIDCFIKGVVIDAPAYMCQECHSKRALFDYEDKRCPHCGSDDIERQRGLYRPWHKAADLPDGYYLILKTGDYCSGWMESGNCANKLNFPTQEDWENHQESLVLSAGIGSTVHARCVATP